MFESPRFVMTIGLAGAGKSTIAKGLMTDRGDITYLSSDAIRLELFGDETRQENHGEVFNLMTKRTRDSLKNGKHVLFDATNINRKKRKNILKQLPKDAHKIALFVSTKYSQILEQNQSRKRVVPNHAINRMYKNMHVPIYSEGWDEIMFMHHHKDSIDKLSKDMSKMIRLGVELGREGYALMDFMTEYFDEFKDIHDLAQDSKYHSFSVSRHTYYVYKHVLNNWTGSDKEIMLWASLLHDIGKSFCKSFTNRKGEEVRYANFIGHENVSSQIAIHVLHRLNFDDEFIQKVTTLIQFHMYLLNKDANVDKLIEYVGQENYEKLKFLREADTLAH